MLGSCRSEEQWKRLCNLPVKEGYVGKEKVTVLQETGCTNVIVSRVLLTDQQWVCALTDMSIQRYLVVGTLVNILTMNVGEFHTVPR